MESIENISKKNKLYAWGVGLNGQLGVSKDKL